MPHGHLWAWHGTPAEGCCLPLFPHQGLWGPRKPWGLTHTLTPQSCLWLGPRMSWVGLADLIWTPQNCKRLAIGLPLWVLLGTVLLSHSLWFNHSSLLFPLFNMASLFLLEAFVDIVASAWNTFPQLFPHWFFLICQVSAQMSPPQRGLPWPFYAK